jgi:quercetin dioxygenase-like cupin family protein
MKVGNTNLTVLELDGESHSSERHDYPEGLFVTDGHVSLIVEGTEVGVNAGGMFVVPAGALHSVAPDSRGTLVIFN